MSHPHEHNTVAGTLKDAVEAAAGMEIEGSEAIEHIPAKRQEVATQTVHTPEAVRTETVQRIDPATGVTTTRTVTREQPAQTVTRVYEQ